jgi:transketolase
MRQAFVETLHEIAASDPRVVLLTADLGFMVLEPFAQSYPDRFFNVGVAEANMVSMATGLAEAGYIPFLYSIATFASMRPYEQFRDGPILHQLPVRLIGIGGGFEYGNSGLTHYALEDIGIMRVQPSAYTIIPADPAQTASAIRQTYDLPNPIYYRIGKNDKLSVRGLDGRFRLGRIEEIGSGSDLLILSAGAITAEVILAVDTLAEANVHCTIGVLSTLRPEPTEDLVNLLKNFSMVVTVEAHYITGGLGSLVAEVIADYGLNCHLARCGVRQMPIGVCGSETYMNDLNGLSHRAIAGTVLEHIAKKHLNKP